MGMHVIATHPLIAPSPHLWSVQALQGPNHCSHWRQTPVQVCVEGVRGEHWNRDLHGCSWGKLLGWWATAAAASQDCCSCSRSSSLQCLEDVWLLSERRVGLCCPSHGSFQQGQLVVEGPAGASVQETEQRKGTQIEYVSDMVRCFWLNQGVKTFCCNQPEDCQASACIIFSGQMKDRETGRGARGAGGPQRDAGKVLRFSCFSI